MGTKWAIKRDTFACESHKLKQIENMALIFRRVLSFKTLLGGNNLIDDLVSSCRFLSYTSLLYKSQYSYLIGLYYFM